MYVRNQFTENRTKIKVGKVITTSYLKEPEQATVLLTLLLDKLHLFPGDFVDFIQ